MKNVQENTKDRSNGKTVLTTGDVARICHVASRTVTKWFDTGKLRGYRIPGSRDRRIPVEQLVAFMKANDMPMSALDGTTRKVLVIDPHTPPGVSSEFAKMENYEVRIAATCFEAGLAAREIIPHVILIALTEDMTVSKAGEIAHSVRDHDLLKGARLFAAVSSLTPERRQRLISNGFDRCVLTPYTAVNLAEVIEDTMNLVI